MKLNFAQFLNLATSQSAEAILFFREPSPVVHRTLCYWTVLLAALLCPIAGFALEQIAGGGLTGDFDAKHHALLKVREQQADSNLGDTSITAVVLEGPQHRRVVDDKTLFIRHEVAPVGQFLRWRVTLRNKGEKQRLLEVRCGFVGSFKSNVAFWDGFELHTDPGTNVVRDTMAQTFPMTCAFTGRSGIGIALPPATFCSYLTHAFGGTEERCMLAQSVRVVVEPRQTEQVEFLLFSFRPTYGYLNALQNYYDAFPDWFRAAGDVDPRVTGGGATYWCWAQNSPEICRRFYGEWEWCYAPFRRTGDWYGREEFWNYTPPRPIGKDRALPREEFLRKRAEQFDRGRHCDAAMLFYLPANIWCEIQLANEKYKDAIVLRDDGSGKLKPIEYLKPWVTGHDNELVIFPWGTSFADACMRDMRQIASELNISGFAFDTANGGIPYRGAGVAKSPGRAWDEAGPYVDLGVAVAKMEEFVHTLRTRDGKRCALVSNPTGRTTFPICFRSDSAMHEYAPYRQLDEQRSVRHLLGRKTMVWWDDYSASPLLNWKKMSPDEIRQAWLGLVDFVLLRSLYMGGIPTPRLTMGVPKLVRELPMIHEVVRAGWQPVPAFKIVGSRAKDALLWTARYGDGLDSFLTLGNASGKEFAGDIQIENSYLGPNTYIFALYGEGVEQQTISGSTTRITVRVPSRQALVLKPVLALPSGWSGSVKVERLGDKLKIEFDEGMRSRGIARLRLGADQKLSRLTLNGQPLDFASETKAVRFDLHLQDRPLIEAAFASRYLALPREALLNFPFEQANIVLSGSNPVERRAAEMLQEYFKFAFSKIVPRKPVPQMEIQQRRDVAKLQGVIRFSDGLTRLERGNLVVNPAPEAMQALLRALDTRFFYPGRFPTGGETPDEKELIQKSGLGGKLLE